MDRLAENRKYYELSVPILKKLYEAKLYDDCLLYAQKLSYHCWFNFAGLYYSYEIENVLNKIGSEILPTSLDENYDTTGANSNHILHICSQLYETGGHTKLLYNWINKDVTHQHTILCTRMSQDDLEKSSKSYLSTSLIRLITLKPTSLVHQAKQLFNLVCKGYKYIVLHIHPDEVLANVVLSHPKLKVPIFFLNHADHTFWLGASITDIAVQIREPNIELDSHRRQITNSYFLPIPIEFTDNTDIKNNNTDEKIKLLSIGLEVKYKPDGAYNFFEEMMAIVEKFPNVVVDIIGVHANSYEAVQHQHPRLYYHGSLPHKDLKNYRADCDLYIESFPMPSFTALLETAMFEKPFLLHYDPKPIFTLFKSHIGIEYPKDKYDWRLQLEKLVSDLAYRKLITKQQYNFISNEYSSRDWLTRLNGLYQAGKKKTAKEDNHKYDLFFDSENERLVASINQAKLYHLSFTEKLDLFTKIKIWRSRPRSFTIVHKINSEQFIKFFFPTLFYTVKKLINR